MKTFIFISKYTSYRFHWLYRIAANKLRFILIRSLWKIYSYARCCLLNGECRRLMIPTFSSVCIGLMISLHFLNQHFAHYQTHMINWIEKLKCFFGCIHFYKAQDRSGFTSPESAIKKNLIRVRVMLHLIRAWNWTFNLRLDLNLRWFGPNMTLTWNFMFESEISASSQIQVECFRAQVRLNLTLNCESQDQRSRSTQECDRSRSTQECDRGLGYVQNDMLHK